MLELSHLSKTFYPGTVNDISGVFLTDSGRITLDGEDITLLPEYRRSKLIGRLFQDPAQGTAPGMSIEENLALAAGWGGWLAGVSRKSRDAFRDRLAMLGMGLEDRMQQPVGLLSGGAGIPKASGTRPSGKGRDA